MRREMPSIDRRSSLKRRPRSPSSTDFFDTEKHPNMTFRSTSITGDGENYELTGSLTIAA